MITIGHDIVPNCLVTELNRSSTMEGILLVANRLALEGSCFGLGEICENA